MTSIGTQEPRHRVNDIVLVVPEGLRDFSLPGDEDLTSDVHGLLVVRGVERSSEHRPDIYLYSLAAVNSRPSVVYLVPERAVEPI